MLQAGTAEFFAEHLGSEAVFAFDREDYGPGSLLGRRHRGEVVLVDRLRPALARLNPKAPPAALDAAIITEQNQSLEHVIPNSIGGRLKSKSLICASCNKTTGNLFDDEFAKFGNILASKYNIKKEKVLFNLYKQKTYQRAKNWQ